MKLVASVGSREAIKEVRMWYYVCIMMFSLMQTTARELMSGFQAYRSSCLL
jgi:hypothetical protein